MKGCEGMSVKTTTGITGRIAVCYDCQWRCESYKTALSEARDHTKIMKHTTAVETAKVNRYEWIKP